MPTFNDLVQIHPSSATPIADTVWSRSSNGSLRGRSRQTGSKLRFDLSIAADQADLASLLSHYQSHIATPFDFIYQGETPEITRTVVYVEPPVFNAADGSFVEIKLVLEEV